MFRGIKPYLLFKARKIGELNQFKNNHFLSL